MGKPRSKRERSPGGSSTRPKVDRQVSKKRRSSSHTNKNKRRKSGTGRYWIEDCKETRSKTGDPALTIEITRVSLTDDHKLPSVEPRQNEEEVGNSVTKDKERGENLPTTPEKSENKSSPGILVSQGEETGSVPTNSEAEARKETREKLSLITSGLPNSFISVKRAASAKLAPNESQSCNPEYEELPNGDCGDGSVNPYPKSEVPDKYWAQRRRLFTRFDEGIQLDKESWFSVTPEVIADHIAEKVVQKLPRRTRDEGSVEEPGTIVLDAFCGCGGNSIAFAKRPEVSLVVCVDTDGTKLFKAAKNASIYRIPTEKLVFVESNACEVMTSYHLGRQRKESGSSIKKECHGYTIGGLNLLPDHIDTIFLSPPWGGMEYETIGRRNFDLEKCIKVSSISGDAPTNGEELLEMAASALEGDAVSFFLPRNINGISVGKSAVKAGYHGQIELEQNVVNGKLKTVTAYLGFGAI